MKILMIKSMWPEKQGFLLNRDNIGDNYIFVHFLSPVVVHLEHGDEKVRPGGCIFFEIYGSQRFESPDTQLIHDWFHSDADLRPLLEKYGVECNKIYYPSQSSEITKIIMNIEFEYLQKKKFYKEIAEAETEKLLALMSRSEIQNTEGEIVDLKRKEEFMNIRSEIHLRFNEDWTVEKMAELARMSPSRFFYIYRKIFGISPQKDLSATRIQRAQILLVQNDYSVEKTAELCGYGDHYNFIRRFKEFTGVTPGRYRRNNAKN